MTSLPPQLLENPADESADEPPATGSRWAKAHHVLLFFVLAATIVWLCSGFYQVNNNEKALVERLGEFLKGPQGKPELIESGLHYAMPWPIDRIHKVSVGQTRTLHLTAFNAPPEAYEDFKKELRSRGWNDDLLSAIFDPYLITADKNVVHVDVAVQYRIKNTEVEAWLMTAAQNLDNPEALGKRDELLEQLTSHVLITALSRLPVERILFEGGDYLPRLLTNELANALKIPNPSDPSQPYDLGVEISKVDVQPPRPPAIVKPAFELVLSSRAEKRIQQDKATADANAMYESAKADRENMIRDSNAYADQVTKAAQGEADRFTNVLTEFKNAPDITRYRVFLDAASNVTRSAERIYWVNPGEHLVITIDPPKFDAGQLK